jgi:hypothetical protein
MATKPKRKHGLSRLERLLESSIRQELAIKGLRDSLMTLSLRVALLERQASWTDRIRPNGILAADWLVRLSRA